MVNTCKKSSVLTQRSQRCDCGSCIGCGLTIRKKSARIASPPICQWMGEFRQTAPSNRMSKSNHQDSDLRTSFRVLTGYRSGAPSFCATHTPIKGQIRHCGVLGCTPPHPSPSSPGCSVALLQQGQRREARPLHAPKALVHSGYRQITIESDHSGQYTTHIGVENRYSLGETKCGNRSCGGATDSWQLRQEFCDEGKPHRAQQQPAARTMQISAHDCNNPGRSRPSTSSCEALASASTSGNRSRKRA